MAKNALNVLIMSDSVVFRNLLEEILGAMPGVVLSGSVSHEHEAIARMRLNAPDLFVMPVSAGSDLLKRLRQEFPATEVIITGRGGARGGETRAKALQLGAIGYVAPIQPGDVETARTSIASQFRPLLSICLTRRISAETRQSIKRAELRASTAPRVTPETVPPAPGLAPRPKRFDLVVIGVSLGGPDALPRVLSGLPSTFPLPVLMVQHMPAAFTEPFAQRLDRDAHLSVREAKDADPVAPGTILLAPGDWHMVVKKSDTAGGLWRVGLHQGPLVNGCRPAADVLFESVAEVCGGNVLAVVMTGMGRDGREGVLALKRRGCYCLTQSEETCTVYGMPQAVVSAGLSDEAVPLDRMATRILELVRRPLS